MKTADVLMLVLPVTCLVLVPMMPVAAKLREPIRTKRLRLLNGAVQVACTVQVLCYARGQFIGALFVLGVVLFLAGCFASRLPERLRHHRRRLMIGGLVFAFAPTLIDLAFNWTARVEGMKAAFVDGMNSVDSSRQ